jgi:hypothetical protein
MKLTPAEKKESLLLIKKALTILTPVEENLRRKGYEATMDVLKNRNGKLVLSINLLKKTTGKNESARIGNLLIFYYRDFYWLSYQGKLVHGTKKLLDGITAQDAIEELVRESENAALAA